MRLLDAMLDALFPPRDTERLVRVAEKDALCAQMVPRTHESGIVSLLPYRTPLAHAAIVEAKFYTNEHAHAMLGAVLAEYLAETVSEERAFGHEVSLVPVPLSAHRRRERGYNQAERICMHAGVALGIPVMGALLARIRDTVPQTSLDGAARRENVRDAFLAYRATPHTTFILIDDVATTGATLAAAASALRAGGAARVICVALAH